MQFTWESINTANNFNLIVYSLGGLVLTPQGGQQHSEEMWRNKLEPKWLQNEIWVGE